MLSFARQNDGNHIMVLANLTDTASNFAITDGPAAGEWRDALTGNADTIRLGATRRYNPWEIRVLVRNTAEDTE